MSYLKEARYLKWKRLLPEKLDRIFETGAPPAGSPDEHYAEYRNAVVEAFRAYAVTMAIPMDDDDWADSEVTWPKRIAR